MGDDIWRDPVIGKDREADGFFGVGGKIDEVGSMLYLASGISIIIPSNFGEAEPNCDVWIFG